VCHITGNKVIVKQAFPISQFDKIESNVSVSIIYSQNENSPVAILEMDSNIVKLFDVFVADNKLIISLKEQFQHCGYSANVLNLYCNSAQLEAISLTGSGNFKSFTNMSGENLTINITGSADIKCENELIYNELNVQIAGSGDLELNGKFEKTKGNITGSGDILLKGKSKTAHFGIAGSGSIDAADFEVDYLTTTLSGSGDIFADVKQSLDAKLVGSGSLTYKGNPQKINTEVTGSGSINQKK
jgi:hypothetical protein